MLTDSEPNSVDWYLLCSASFSDKWIKQLKADLKTFMAKKEKDVLYYNFINWQKKSNEILVWTMHAYADIAIPKHFDMIFQLDKPENFVEVKYVIKQVIINDWMATNQISSGHKHIAIIEFETSVPEIFDLLSTPEQYVNGKNPIQLCFCDKEYFESIKLKMNQRLA